MDELLELLEHYSPGYRHQIEGTDEWELDKLEEIFGRPLPRFYREFAQVMGQDGGPLLAHVNAYQPRWDVGQIYRVLPDSELPPRRFLFIFGDPSVDGQHYWLDLEAPSEEGDSQVVRMPFGHDSWKTKLSPLHVSLREMLFVWAMSQVHLPSFPQRAQYSLRSRDLAPAGFRDAEDLARILERLGFTRLPYPRRCMLFERADAGILLYRRPTGPGFSFEVGMQEPEEFRRVQAIIEENTGMTKN